MKGISFESAEHPISKKVLQNELKENGIKIPFVAPILQQLKAFECIRLCCKVERKK
jgi:hypothetical protein